jgi:excisionase family DNA binding protein
MIPVLYTPEEVAEKLKVTRRTVYQWLLDGKLPGLRAGDKWRVAEDELMAFLGAPRTASKKPRNRSGRARQVHELRSETSD